MSCETCGQSEAGAERLRSFGFKVHYCKDCDPEAPSKPEPKEIVMEWCDVHQCNSTDPDTGVCSLCRVG